jgi:hypothetical protein
MKRLADARTLASTIRAAGIDCEGASMLTDDEWATVATVARVDAPGDEVIEMALTEMESLSLAVAA